MFNRMRPRQLAAVVWTLLLLTSTSVPIPEMPVPEPELGGWTLPADKLVHAALFAVFAVLWSLAFSATRGWWWRVGAAGLGLAVATELIQMIPALNRQADWDDLAADAIGVAVGLMAALAMLSLKRVRTARHASSMGARPGHGGGSPSRERLTATRS